MLFTCSLVEAMSSLDSLCPEPDSSPTFDEVAIWLGRFKDELFGNVLPFWFEHSFDEKNGGFYACLNEDGSVYDRRKFMWLNGRQLYVYSRMCGQYSSEDLHTLSEGRLPLDAREVMIRQVLKSAEFLCLHGVDRQTGFVYFSLNERGEPYHFERKIFSACFLCLGLGALAWMLRRSPEFDEEVESGEGNGCKEKSSAVYARRCLLLLRDVIALSHDPTPLGRPACPGAPRVSPMNVPMILLNMLCELKAFGVLAMSAQLGLPEVSYTSEEDWCVAEILKHVKTDCKMVFEVVSTEGTLVEGYDGRHLNPGHSIEAGWFLYAHALQCEGLANITSPVREDTCRAMVDKDRIDRLKRTAEDMVNWSYSLGWDQKCGGLYYFLDSEGNSPPFLEWSMKLWWPHCEALVAFALLYLHTRCAHFWTKFIEVANYTLDHFSDSPSKANSGQGEGRGEWFGYLDREGRVTHRFKGGPYKGCFHVPRACFLVYEILKQIQGTMAMHNWRVVEDR